MRHAPLLLAALLALVPLAGAGGAYAGTLAQGETDTHTYDNNPRDDACIQLAVPYTVTLAHAPATDTLTLAVGGKTAATQNGLASVTFVSGICTRFDIAVTGTRVDTLAAYTLTITQHVGGLGHPIAWG